MSYTTPSEVRLRLGLTEDDAPDSIVNKFIIDAQNTMLKDISAYRMDEELYGNIDGNNKVYYTENRFIADTDFDQIIDENDITVNIWTDLTDPGTKSSTTVTSIDSNSGQITLTTAPPSTTAKITCDYRFYFSQINWVLLSMMTSYLAGYMWVLRDRLLLPDNVSFGSMKWRISFPQWRELWKEYERLMQRLRGGMAVHGTMSIPPKLTRKLPIQTRFSNASDDEVI